MQNLSETTAELQENYNKTTVQLQQNNSRTTAKLRVNCSTITKKKLQQKLLVFQTSGFQSGTAGTVPPLERVELAAGSRMKETTAEKQSPGQPEGLVVITAAMEQ